MLTIQNNIEQCTQQKNDDHNKKIPIIIKIFMILLLFSCYFIFYFTWITKIQDNCILDRFHEWLYGFNRFLYNEAQQVFIGISQVFIDFWGIFILILWISKIKNSRFPVTLGIFYAIRSCFLEIQRFPFPDLFLWDSPGFPSIFVPYDPTRDFFYSGHTGLLVIITLELYTLQLRKISTVCGLCLLFTILILLGTRVHYTIDVIAAIIYTYYIHMLIEKEFLVFLDYIASQPTVLALKIYQKCRKNQFIAQTNQQKLIGQIKNNNISK